MNAEEQNRRFDDTAFNKISPFISLQKEEISVYNRLLIEVTENVIQKLLKDDLFRSLYRNLIFVGSFYKQTRVGKPEEFDINVIINLPNIDKAIIERGQPGFARIKFRKADLSSQWTDNKILKNWLDADNYLNNDQVRRWFESISQKSLRTLERSFTNNGYLILPSKLDFPFEIKIRKNGPAFTLCVKYDSKNFDVDLVPVLEFKNDPPLSLAKKFINLKMPWYLVPKPLNDVPQAGRYWRYCFYKHEQQILKDSGKIKAVIRTIKKLRDTQEWSILASYYIESLFYHALDSISFRDNVNKLTQTSLLMIMIKRLKVSLERRKLDYFWDPSLNLFQSITVLQTIGIVKRIDKIISDIESQPHCLYNYILTKEELQKLKNSYETTPSSTPSSTPSTSGLFDYYIPLILEGINTLTTQEKPQTDRTSAPESVKSSEQSKINTLQNLVSTLVDEVRDLKARVVILENKVERISSNRNRTYTPSVDRRDENPIQAFFNIFNS